MKLALVNLISNAVKFTSSRPRAEIEIGCREDENEDVCFIKDNGVGFNMDQLTGSSAYSSVSILKTNLKAQA